MVGKGCRSAAGNQVLSLRMGESIPGKVVTQSGLIGCIPWHGLPWVLQGWPWVLQGSLWSHILWHRWPWVLPGGLGGLKGWSEKDAGVLPESGC